ncbi:GxxExxY protein [Candidatus Kuenenbacteria bacterium]|nr:GxxExxY protein [Candidatus Kuenenbacteria bacterium]
MEIYNTLGPGHKEKVYGNAFEELLKRESILYEREKTLHLMMEGKVVGYYKPDFVPFGKIIVEFKSVLFIPEVFIKKLYQYLTTSEYKLGFIVNFGAKNLEIVRRVHEKSWTLQ